MHEYVCWHCSTIFVHCHEGKTFDGLLLLHDEECIISNEI